MSIAGGVDHAPGRAAAAHCRALQIFVKNNNRWTGPPITAAQATAFSRNLDAAGISIDHVFAHTCYLINLASPKEELAEKSLDALVDELERCGQLGVPGLVMHPGSHVGTGAEEGMERIARLCKEAIARTPEVATRILLETTAGTGSNLGADFSELQTILDLVADPDRMGVCLDTCHIFAAGHDIRTKDVYTATMQAFADTVRFDRLFAVHLNDSKHDLGSRKDRHEHIGQGLIGDEAFRLLLSDKRFSAIPMALETEKGDDLAEDRMNLERLHNLVGEAWPA